MDRSFRSARKPSAGEYTVSLPAEVTLRHYQLWRESVVAKKPCVQFEVDTSGKVPTVELTIIGRERKGLLAQISEVLQGYGFNILSAKLFSLPSDSVMDIFRLDDRDTVLEDASRAHAVYEDLVAVMESDGTVPVRRRGVHDASDDDGGARSSGRPAASEGERGASVHGGQSRTPEPPGDSLSSARQAAAAALAAAEHTDLPHIGRSLSNIALSDLEQQARELMAQRYLNARKDADRTFLQQGGLLYRYSFSTGKRRREHVHVDLDTKELRWSSAVGGARLPATRRLSHIVTKHPESPHSSSSSSMGTPGATTTAAEHGARAQPDTPIRIHSVSLERCEKILHGAQSPVLAAFGEWRLPDPDWLCFSLVLDERTVDFAARNDDELMAWLFGLQNLCDKIPPADRVTRHGVLLRRAHSKLRALAHARNWTVRAFLLRHLRECCVRLRAEEISVDAGREYCDMGVPSERGTVGILSSSSSSTSASMPLPARAAAPAGLIRERGSGRGARQSAEALHEELHQLQHDLDISRDRIQVLKTKLRDAQKSWEIDFAEIALGERIGGGAFSELYRAEWRSSVVAAKVISVDKGADSVIRDFCEEVNVLSKLRHNNIVLFMGAVPRIPKLAIITEFCFGGNVFAAIRTHLWRRLQHADLVSLARDAARGMAYLHAAGLMHRDLKSQNLLLDKPLALGRPTIKVADFGLSRALMCSASTSASSAGALTAETGTYRWMAPEMIRHERYTEKVDVYSYGVTLWEFFSAEIPFKNMTPIQAAFAVADKGARPPLTSPPDARTPWVVPRQWAYLIQRCWRESEAERPTFATVVQWLNAMEEEDPRRAPSWAADS
ncbi:hypothetical protein CDCA_CDCA06G1735 [Cyanidium caldarium]|uniref:non-specific serine/threonine protein kinase n=1 Tax=Cyanidium caldarium TaxID=2771 RepID=A0AAV9IUB4_CYACA|nr:hypothetical protein CDCA_CDCA06G1735 [Cyanidium caldarium]